MELGNLFFGNSRGKYPLERDEWQELFHEFLEDIGLDSYGNSDSSFGEYQTDRGGFENEVFLVNPYYWGGDEDIAEEHNFVYKPKNITIDWYKYPLRDSYSNVEITLEEFKEMLSECKKSIKTKY